MGQPITSVICSTKVRGKYQLHFIISQGIAYIIHFLKNHNINFFIYYRYDSHFLIRDIARGFTGKIEVIPHNKENFISLKKHVDGYDITYKFIDSYRFLAESLDKLSSHLTDFNILDEEFKKDYPDLSTQQLDLLKKKGVFPYEYLDSIDKLNDSELPSKNKFNSCLTGCKIKKQDYYHAKKVWETFNIKNLGEYSELYLKTDVLLLAQVFENFRTTCLEVYNLDPASYYTAPGLSWDSMLKHTKIELQLIKDIDMHLFIEKGVIFF